VAAAVPTGLKSTLTHGSAPTTAPLESERNEATPQQAEVLKAIAGSLKDESAEAYHERGIMYLMMGEEESLTDAYRLATADFSKAVALDPAMVGGYNNRAMVYSRLGEHEKALQDFQSAIKIDPKNAALHMRHAGVLSKLGRDQEAVKVYAQAYALGDVDCLFNRGNAYMRLGKNDLARQDFETVIQKSQNPQIVEAAKMNLEATQ
jgi:Tfp pilus assembly protein PilF